MKKHIVIPVFVPHKGCPFDCIYCNQKIISGQTIEASEEDIRNTIEEHLKTSGDAFVEIGFYGGSFTGIPVEQQKWYLKIGHSYIKTGKVQQLRLSTRPDYIDDKILDLLIEYGVKTIELGAQSLDEEVLSCSNRGHDIGAVIKAALLIKEKGLKLGIQTMIGLPNDSREKALITANRVVQMKPDIVRIYPTLVIKNTYLEKMYLDGRYVPLTIDEAVNICAELLSIYEQNNINVIRIGLQPTDNISESGDVIAGPFHPAFRQLVQSRLILDKMLKQFESEGYSGVTDIIIECRPKEISNVIGQKRKNINYLKKALNLKNIEIRENDNIIDFKILKA